MDHTQQHIFNILLSLLKQNPGGVKYNVLKAAILDVAPKIQSKDMETAIKKITSTISGGYYILKDEYDNVSHIDNRSENDNKDEIESDGGSKSSGSDKDDKDDDIDFNVRVGKNSRNEDEDNDHDNNVRASENESNDKSKNNGSENVNNSDNGGVSDNKSDGRKNNSNTKSNGTSSESESNNNVGSKNKRQSKHKHHGGSENKRSDGIDESDSTQSERESDENDTTHSESESYNNNNNNNGRNEKKHHIKSKSHGRRNNKSDNASNKSDSIESESSQSGTESDTDSARKRKHHRKSKIHGGSKNKTTDISVEIDNTQSESESDNNSNTTSKSNSSDTSDESNNTDERKNIKSKREGDKSIESESDEDVDILIESDDGNGGGSLTKDRNKSDIEDNNDEDVEMIERLLEDQDEHDVDVYMHSEYHQSHSEMDIDKPQPLSKSIKNMETNIQEDEEFIAPCYYDVNFTPAKVRIERIVDNKLYVSPSCNLGGVPMKKSKNTSDVLKEHLCGEPQKDIENIPKAKPIIRISFKKKTEESHNSTHTSGSEKKYAQQDDNVIKDILVEKHNDTSRETHKIKITSHKDLKCNEAQQKKLVNEELQEEGQVLKDMSQEKSLERNSMFKRTKQEDQKHNGSKRLTNQRLDNQGNQLKNKQSKDSSIDNIGYEKIITKPYNDPKHNGINEKKNNNQGFKEKGGYALKEDSHQITKKYAIKENVSHEDIKKKQGNALRDQVSALNEKPLKDLKDILKEKPYDKNLKNNTMHEIKLVDQQIDNKGFNALKKKNIEKSLEEITVEEQSQHKSKMDPFTSLSASDKVSGKAHLKRTITEIPKVIVPVKEQPQHRYKKDPSISLNTSDELSGKAPSKSTIEMIPKVQNNSSCHGERKFKDSSHKQVEEYDFYKKYEGNQPRVWEPINDIGQFKEYVREYEERYTCYELLKKHLLIDIEHLSKQKQNLDLDKQNMKGGKQNFKELKEIYCKRFYPMKKTYIFLHKELQDIKERIGDFYNAHSK